TPVGLVAVSGPQVAAPPPLQPSGWTASTRYLPSGVIVRPNVSPPVGRIRTTPADPASCLMTAMPLTPLPFATPLPLTSELSESKTYWPSGVGWTARVEFGRGTVIGFGLIGCA